MIETAVPLLLLLVTAYYAYQVRVSVDVMKRSVDVMEETRRADHTPRFGMQIVFLGERWTGIRITQVGPGAAIDADLRLKFIPFRHLSDTPVIKSVRLGVAQKGRRVHVQAPCEHNSLQQFCTTYQRVELEGTAKDALGNVHEISEVLDELQSFAYLPHNGVRYSEPSELAASMQKIADQLESMKWFFVETHEPVTDEDSAEETSKARHPASQQPASTIDVEDIPF